MENSNHFEEEEEDYENKNKLDLSNLEPDTGHFLFKFRLRYWYASLLIVIVVLSLVMIGSISTPRWSEQGSGGKEWRSGLLKCGGCQGRWTNTYIASIVNDAQSNGVNGYLTTFRNLRNGAIFYVIFESLSLLMALVWIAFIWALMLQKLLISEKAILIVVTCLILFHTIALAGWFGFTGAQFGQDCSRLSDYNNSHSICPTHGPAMAVFIEIFLFMLAVIFYVIFSKRKTAVNRDKLILG